MKRNIFRVETKLRTFTYQIIKISLFALVIAAVLLLACLIDIWVASELLTFFFDLLAVAILLACLFGIGVAGAEIDATIENRKKSTGELSEQGKEEKA